VKYLIAILAALATLAITVAGSASADDYYSLRRRGSLFCEDGSSRRFNYENQHPPRWVHLSPYNELLDEPATMTVLSGKQPTAMEWTREIQVTAPYTRGRARFVIADGDFHMSGYIKYDWRAHTPNPDRYRGVRARYTDIYDSGDERGLCWESGWVSTRGRPVLLDE
jgi:hypothetical protein